MRDVSTTDRERVAEAFKALRRKGYTARMAFSCCGSCAAYEIAEWRKERGLPVEGPEARAVFYSKQGNSSYGEDGNLVYTLYLSWSGDAGDIVAALREAGLAASHDGSDDSCVFVHGHGEAARRRVEAELARAKAATVEREYGPSPEAFTAEQAAVWREARVASLARRVKEWEAALAAFGEAVKP